MKTYFQKYYGLTDKANEPEPDCTEQGRRPEQCEADAKCFAWATLGILIILIGCIVYLAIA